MHYCVNLTVELTRQSLQKCLQHSLAFDRVFCRGKSGLHRVECQVTPGGREPTESAAENRPPMVRSANTGKGEKVR